MNLLAIDPGPEESAYVLYDTVTQTPLWWNMAKNVSVLVGLDGANADSLAIETIVSYGMSVGAEVFTTCVWVGRFAERWDCDVHRSPARLVPRPNVKMHICGSMRAKDTNIRQALIDRYGPGKEKAKGTKASPGPLYGISKHVWSALAVAITASETEAK